MKSFVAIPCIIASAGGAATTTTGLSSTTFQEIIESHESSAFNLVAKLLPSHQHGDERSGLLFSIDTSPVVNGSARRKVLAETEEEEAFRSETGDEESGANNAQIEEETADDGDNSSANTVADDEDEEDDRMSEVLWGHQVNVDQNNATTAEDETYQSILKLEDKAFAHRCHVAVAQDQSTTHLFPVVFCDFLVPVGLNVTAEIRDDTSCEDFTDESRGDYYTRGVASALLIPDISDDEKLRGIFDHSYCARLDVHYNGESVIERRYLMDITYHYNVDKRTGAIKEHFTAEVHDENSAAEKNRQAVSVGLGVFAGVIITLALLAIIVGRKKKSHRQEIRQGRQRYEDERNVEMEILNAFEIGDFSEGEGDIDTKASLADSAAAGATGRTRMEEERDVAEEENEIV